MDSSHSLHVTGIHLFVNTWNLLWDIRNQYLPCLDHAVLWLPVPCTQSCKCCFHSHTTSVLWMKVVWVFVFFSQDSWAALHYPKLISYSARHQQIDIYTSGGKNKVIPNASGKKCFFSSKCIKHIETQLWLTNCKISLFPLFKMISRGKKKPKQTTKTNTFLMFWMSTPKTWQRTNQQPRTF